MLEQRQSAGSEEISPPSSGVVDAQRHQTATIQDALHHCDQLQYRKTEQYIDLIWNDLAEVVRMAHDTCGGSDTEEGDFCEYVEPILEELLNLRDEIADATDPRSAGPSPETSDLPTILSDVQSALRRLLAFAGDNVSRGASAGIDQVGQREKYGSGETTECLSLPFAIPGNERREKPEVRVYIRWMIRRDMAEVLQIESESFEFPWLEDDFIRCLRQRNCIGMCAEYEDRVVGFMIYELHKTRIHLLNLAVTEQMRRRGVGSQMVEKLVAKLSVQRRNRILAEVRETNLDAQLFFRENDFRAVSVLRDFYEDTPEDAYLMQYRHDPRKERRDSPMNRISRFAG